MQVGRTALFVGLAMAAMCRLAFSAADLFLAYSIYPAGGRDTVAIGDVNGDGSNDVVATSGGTVNVFLQSGGQLTGPTNYVGGNGNSVAVGDVNHDGRNDVIVSALNAVGVLYQNGLGGLDPVTNYPTQHSSFSNVHKLRVADLNNDGLLDVVSIDWGTQSRDVDVFLQKLDGTLNTSVVYTVLHNGYDDLEAGDVNNDGLTDIVVMSGQSSDVPNFGVLLQNASGTFGTAVYYNVGANILARGIGVGDVNNDGRRDVIVSCGWDRIAAFLQNASGSLDTNIAYSSYENPDALEVADVTGDGRSDVVVLHEARLKLGVYRQDATGALQPEELYSLPYNDFYNPHGIAVGDINSDGLPDVVVADPNNGLVVLRRGPIVNIATTDATAAEPGTETGAFSVTRSNLLQNPLTVYLAYGGTATAGTDYIAPTAITFPPFVSTTNIVVMPLDDLAGECTETISVSVASNPNYILGTAATAADIYLADDGDGPLVTVTASDPNAFEFGLDPGIFRINRAACATNLLTVNFVVEGTAIAGDDYSNLVSSITFPTNGTQYSLLVKPIADTIAEGDETVMLTLLPGVGYNVGSPSNATVVIHDRPRDTWRLSKFTAGELSNPDISGDLADPDGDGYMNLLEYALVMEPKVASSAGLPSPQIENGYLTLTYTRPLGTVDVSYVTEVSGSVTGVWNSGSAYIHSSSVITNGTLIVKDRDRTPVNSLTNRFMRLRIAPLP